jgi:hypothetical protein
MHALRVRGVANDESLAVVVGDAVGPLPERLDALTSAGMVRALSGRISGYTLSKEGRVRHLELLEEDRTDGGLVQGLRPAYERFLAANQPFIDLCSAWQMRRDNGEPNDHTDEAYDSGLLSELEDFHKVGDEVGAETATVAQRFQSYQPRFENAIERVRAGETEYFTKPVIDSYHTVWLELHEDLLLSQDIERAEGR